MKERWQGYAEAALSKGAVTEKRQPTRAQGLESEVAVPLKQATTTGLLLLLTVCTLALIIGGGILLRLPFGPVAVIATTALLFWLVVDGLWLYLLFANRAMLWQVERVIGKDLDGDRQIGPTPYLLYEIDKPADEDHGEHLEFHDVPLSKRRQYAGLITYCRAMLHTHQAIIIGEIVSDEVTFSERSANQYGGYSQKEFKILREYFIRCGWAEWNHPTSEQQGASITEEGWVHVERFASQMIPRN